MKGQWIGRYEGTNTGSAIVEIDEIGDHYEGRVYAYDDNQSLPSTFAFVRTANLADNFELELHLAAIDPVTIDVTDWHLIEKRFPGVTFPTKAQTSWRRIGGSLKITWLTDIGTKGEGILRRSDANRSSELVPIDVQTWDDFRRYFSSLEQYRYIYRGQENNLWRLQTSFHRTDRSDLVRYLNLDIPALHQNITSLTRHFFNLADPIQHGAFVNLVQHHGYPTPLLDWTFSPFIAAYFAFKRAIPPFIHEDPEAKVRILMFDAQKWREDWNQLQKVAPARPHFSLFQAAALENPRMVPQQALSSVTNMEDIEEYIATKETDGKRYLFAVDLPVKERVEVLKELSSMGITSGALFPGLDGTCGQLKDRFFGF